MRQQIHFGRVGSKRRIAHRLMHFRSMLMVPKLFWDFIVALLEHHDSSCMPVYNAHVASSNAKQMFQQV